jgi:two-component system sensor histidine kinase QseC
MSLRLRLTLLLGAVFLLLWSLAAAWMLRDLRNEMMLALDQRLAASTRMVAGILEQLPQPLANAGQDISLKAAQLGIPEGLVCQVSSLRGEVLVRNQSSPEPLMDAQHNGFHNQLIDGVEWRSFTYEHGDLRITTADRLSERVTLKHSILLAAALPAAFALLGSLGLLWFSVGQGLAPLKRMGEALAQRSADSLEPLHLQPLPRELQPLVDSQNQLLQRIVSAIENERRLTSYAAHELRSPLTAIITHLQVAQMTSGVASRQALAQAQEASGRLHRTLEQLLLLARIEGNQSFDDGQCYSLEDVARLAVADTEQIADRQIKLQLPASPPHAQLAMPALLAITALRNLLDNALRHTPADSYVELSLALRPGWVSFQVHDHGPGIAQDQLQYFTLRFWRHGKSAGCGLGLAIVQTIAQRAGGALHFDNQTDGLRVRLDLPLRQI